MSRLNDIRTAVSTIVSAAFTASGFTATLKSDPQALENYSESELPIARIIFVEQQPERLDFRQELRRVFGEVAIGMAAKDATRETVDTILQAIRDGIYSDETLTNSVDYVVAEAGRAWNSPDDAMIYGTIDVSTEEVF